MTGKFTDEKTVSWKNCVSCPGTHNQVGEALRFKPKPAESKVHSFYSVLWPPAAGWEVPLR